MKFCFPLFLVVSLFVVMALPAAAADEPVVFGKWEFHSTITFSLPEQYVSFSASNGTIYSCISADSTRTSLRFHKPGGSKTTVFGSNGWVFDPPVIDFGSEPQTVSFEFYEWLLANAVLLKCDGSDCPSSDLNKDNVCDDCGLEFLVLRDYGPYTVRKFMADIGNILTSAVSWVSDVGAAIISQPLLLAFTALPLCGLGIGVFRRLRNAN